MGINFINNLFYCSIADLFYNCTINIQKQIKNIVVLANC